jgi:uncharacterized protein (TIGR00106 family)
MLAEFSIVPLGTGSSTGNQMAEIMKIIDSSGIPYKVNPMGTVVEGEWEEVLNLIRKCHSAAFEGSERILTSIRIDDRKGKKNRIEEKVKSVERRLGKTLNK